MKVESHIGVISVKITMTKSECDTLYHLLGRLASSCIDQAAMNDAISIRQDIESAQRRAVS